MQILPISALMYTEIESRIISTMKAYFTLRKTLVSFILECSSVSQAGSCVLHEAFHSKHEACKAFCGKCKEFDG